MVCKTNKGRSRGHSDLFERDLSQSIEHHRLEKFTVTPGPSLVSVNYLGFNHLQWSALCRSFRHRKSTSVSMEQLHVLHLDGSFCYDACFHCCAIHLSLQYFVQVCNKLQFLKNSIKHKWLISTYQLTISVIVFRNK